MIYKKLHKYHCLYKLNLFLYDIYIHFDKKMHIFEILLLYFTEFSLAYTMRKNRNSLRMHEDM